MKSPHYKVKIGIVGCGAIGSRMAETIHSDFSKDCRITGLFDVDRDKALILSKKLKLKSLAKRSLSDLINKCDCMIEAVNSNNTEDIIKQALQAKKSVLAMSVGKLLKAQNLFKLAKKNKCYILLPSGAIAGVDTIKAAALKNIHKITLTTRKPPSGFKESPYLRQKGIDLTKIKGETTIFHGRVEEAVKLFPQNINVASTIALAGHCADKLTIKIITSPKFKVNSHEIEMIGDFGKMITRTENVVCPDNPKSSYLAVLSGLQTLKQYCTGILIGT